MLRNLVLKSYLHRLSYYTIVGGITRVLAFKVILKMHYKSSFKYLAIKDAAKSRI